MEEVIALGIALVLQVLCAVGLCVMVTQIFQRWERSRRIEKHQLFDETYYMFGRCETCCEAYRRPLPEGNKCPNPKCNDVHYTTSMGLQVYATTQRLMTRGSTGVMMFDTQEEKDKNDAGLAMALMLDGDYHIQTNIVFNWAGNSFYCMEKGDFIEIDEACKRLQVAIAKSVETERMRIVDYYDR